MRTAATVVVLTILGCGPQFTPETAEIRNNNNGERKAFSFHASAVANAAVGGVKQVLIAREESGLYLCGTAQEDCGANVDVLPHSCPRPKCSLADPWFPIAKVTAASCDQGLCDAVIKGDVVEMKALKAGAGRLTVNVELTDGSTLTDWIPVAFFEPDLLRLECMSNGLCPGPNAVFVGASFLTLVRFEGGGKALLGDVALSIEPAGILEVTPTGSPALNSLRAVAPGTATVKLDSGSLTWETKVRVVSPTDVVAAELRLLKPPLNPKAGGEALQWDVDLIGPAAPADVAPLVWLMPVWSLAGGGYAIGGAGDVTTPTEEARLDQQPKHADSAMFKVTPPPSCPDHAFPIEVTRGAVKLAWTFAATCP